MRTLTWLSAATALLALAACDSAPAPVAEDDNAAAEATPARPAFAVDLDGAAKLIDEIGAPWKGGATKDGIRDATTGGAIRTLTAPGGNAQIFTRPDGKVWQMRLIVVPVSGCSESAALKRALPNLVATLAPSTPFSTSQRLAIEDDMVSTLAKTHDLAAIRIVVLGGCTHTMTLTAL